MFGDVTLAQSPFAALGGKSVAASVTDSVTAEDSSQIGAVVLGKVLAEYAAASDAFVSANNIFAASATESAEAQATQTTIATMLAAVLEQADAASAQAVAANMLVAVSEEVSAEDGLSASAILLGFVSELVAAADAPSGAKVFVAAVSEAAEGSDSPAIQVVFSGTVSEFASASASVGALRTANVSVTGIQLYVSIGGSLVWAVINDTQNPNWQNLPS